MGEATNVNPTWKCFSLDSPKTKFCISPNCRVAFIAVTPLKSEHIRGEESRMTCPINRGGSRESGEQTQSRKYDFCINSTSPSTTQMYTSLLRILPSHTRERSWTAVLFEFLSVAYIFVLSISSPKPNFSLNCE
jgi:hypothetical protein